MVTKSMPLKMCSRLLLRGFIVIRCAIYSMLYIVLKNECSIDVYAVSVPCMQSYLTLIYICCICSLYAVLLDPHARVLVCSPT